MIASSGMRLLELYPRQNPNGLLAKMLKALLTSKTAWCSDRSTMTWKAKVSKRKVLLYQLAVKVHGIKENVSGSLGAMRRTFPTPTTFDQYEFKNPRKKSSGGQKPPLTQVVHMMYPTPSASCQMDVVAPPETVTQNSVGWSVTRVGTGTKFGAKLNDVVNKLEKMYPTPTARDHKDLGYNPITCKREIKQQSVPTTVLKNNKPGGKLNPTFVEFLMGYPMNWTKIEPIELNHSETQSFHKSQEKLD